MNRIKEFMKISVLLAILLAFLMLGGCAFNIKNTETFHHNNSTEKVTVFFNPPVVMNWWGAEKSKSWALTEVKKEVLPVDK